MANQTSSTEKDPAMTEYNVESHPKWTFRL